MMPLQQLMKHDAIEEPAQTKPEKDTRVNREAAWISVLHEFTRAPVGIWTMNKPSPVLPFL
jgi:hypothetical protein